MGQRLFSTKNLSSEKPIWKEIKNVPKSSTYRIATHQYNENIIALATNSGIYLSKNSGKTWQVKGSFPSLKPKAIVMDKNTNEGIYILTDLTVFYIDETLENWVEFNKGLPLQNLSDMRIAYYPNKDNRLYVSKYGRGVWSSNLFSSLTEKAKPVVDFAIHGTSSNTIELYQKVKLISHALNATSLKWTIKNDTDVIIVENNTTPEVTLNKEGYYSVTLVATNAKGATSKVKEQFILVPHVAKTPKCKLTYTKDIPWYKRMKTISINTSTYTVPNTNNYINSTKNFTLAITENAQLQIKDNHKGYNSYIKAWIDFNNDGAFDEAKEEVGSSNGKKEEFTTTFTVPSNTVLNKPLLMRVTALESNEAPTSCQKTGTTQTVDLHVVVKPNITFTTSYNNLKQNSVTLNATYNGAFNSSKAGFVYSTHNSNFTLNNAEVVTNTATQNNTSYTNKLTGLEYNTTYYYKAFVATTEGVFYSDIGKFTLPKYKIPLAESLIALNTDANTWELKGVVFPEDNMLTALEIEYGIDNFENSKTFNPTSFPANKQFEIKTTIATEENRKYTFRIKYTTNNKIYYSNIYSFETSKEICNPTINEVQWFRLIKNVTFNGNSNDSSGNTGYENFTSIVHNVEQGKSYPIEITDSYAPGFNLNYAVFIDYNNDGDFNDYNEIVAQGTPNNETFNSSITIPKSDIIFNTELTMRVIASNGAINSCAIGIGEIEDYTISITKVDDDTDENDEDDQDGDDDTDEAINDNIVLKVYPNPVNENIYILTNTPVNEYYYITIFNAKGALVLEKKIVKTKDKEMLNLKELNTGIYIMHFKNNTSSKAIKILKI